MLKAAGPILELSEGTGLPVVVVEGGRVICVQNFIAGTELWVDGNFEMIAAKWKEWIQDKREKL